MCGSTAEQKNQIVASEGSSQQTGCQRWGPGARLWAYKLLPSPLPGGPSSLLDGREVLVVSKQAGHDWLHHVAGRLVEGNYGGLRLHPARQHLCRQLGDPLVGGIAGCIGQLCHQLRVWQWGGPCAVCREVGVRGRALRQVGYPVRWRRNSSTGTTPQSFHTRPGTADQDPLISPYTGAEGRVQLPEVALNTAQRVEVLPISRAVERCVEGGPGAAAGRVTSVVVLPPGTVLPSTAGGGAAGGREVPVGRPGMVAPAGTAGQRVGKTAGHAVNIARQNSCACQGVLCSVVVCQTGPDPEQ